MSNLKSRLKILDRTANPSQEQMLVVTQMSEDGELVDSYTCELGGEAAVSEPGEVLAAFLERLRQLAVDGRIRVRGEILLVGKDVLV